MDLNGPVAEEAARIRRELKIRNVTVVLALLVLAIILAMASSETRIPTGPSRYTSEYVRDALTLPEGLYEVLSVRSTERFTWAALRQKETGRQVFVRVPTSALDRLEAGESYHFRKHGGSIGHFEKVVKQPRAATPNPAFTLAPLVAEPPRQNPLPSRK